MAVKFNHGLFVFIGVAVIVSIVVGAFLFIASQVSDTETMKPKYEAGQMVKMSAFGTEGMVVYARCYKSKCYYSVRFSSLQLSTTSHLFGSGGPVTIAPVALVNGILEFELRAAK